MLFTITALLKKIIEEVVPQDMFVLSNEKDEFLFPVRSEGGILEPDTWLIFLCKDIQGYTFKYSLTFKELLSSMNVVSPAVMEGALKSSIIRGVNNFKERFKDEMNIKREILNKEKVNAAENLIRG